MTPLLILDLDNTLIFGTAEPLARPADWRVGPYHIYARSHLARFFQRVTAHYRLAVWTAATQLYAEEVVKHSFPPDARLEFLWSRGHCKPRMDIETREEYWLKDLTKLRRHGHDLDRILFVDDTAKNLSRNYGNLIAIAPYSGETEDNELMHLASFLESVTKNASLRKLEKRGWRKRTEG